ncbi:MAG: ABC transporter substrate-binding protein [Lactobacillales bacterium]|nr:ABC transporter substrate-binding protein [Lactobacillales bacterium]
MKKLAKILIVLSVVLLPLSGCQRHIYNGNAPTKDEIKIGVDMELSGPLAIYGQECLKGAELATEQINKDGGLLGRKVKLVIKDNKSSALEAALTAANLASRAHVVAIFGAATSGAVKAMVPSATTAKVPVLTPTATNDAITHDPKAKIEYIFRGTFPDSYQGLIIGKYLNQIGAKRVAVLMDNSNDYCLELDKSFQKTYKGEIVERDNFISGDKNFQAQLTKIKSQNVDALFVPAYFNEAGLIIKQAREMGINCPIFGADGFSSETLGEIAGDKNVSNVYYTDTFNLDAKPQSPLAQPFVDAYKKKFGKEPSSFASLSYDTMEMLFVAIKKSGDGTSANITKQLALIKNLQGVSGDVTINKFHDAEKPVVMVKKMDNKIVSAEFIK